MKFLFLMLLAAPLSAAGPLFEHKDKYADQEFENVYQDIKNVTNRTLDLSSVTINHLTVSGSYAGIAVGKYLQFVSSQATNQASTSGTTYVTAGPAATITLASASNKVQICVAGTLRNTALGSGWVMATIRRGTTDLSTTGTGFWAIQASVATGAFESPLGGCVIDQTPGSVGPLTYAVGIKTSGGGESAVYPSIGNAVSSAMISLTEIKQ